MLPIIGLAQNSAFTLKVKLDAIPSATKLYLSYNIPGKLITDSAILNKGLFIFNGTIPYPLKAQLWMDHNGTGLKHLGNDPDNLTFFLDSGEIDINSTDSIKKSIITGSRINTEYLKYKAFIAGPVKEMALIANENAAATTDQKNDAQFMGDISSRLKQAAENKKELQLQYIKLNPNSEFSLGALHEIAGSHFDIAIIEPLYNSLSANIKNTVAGKEFAKAIEAARTTAVGSIAPAFTQNDVNDKPVSLADFRGKYVLLDFWASWCAPCRAENPNVLKAYQQYHDKNFTVLSVSLDRPGKKDAWLAAIKTDGLNWTQVSDLNFWNNQVAKQYGVTTIPQNFLIDPNGKIIAENLHGDELQKKLAEVLSR
ncbi:peroxiredoxin [Mucilaginibacter frigoritolerans]|uniref:Peroxiredoxin n=2 Tax=Mucilaginibacter frigoritolerans TaxID=652788 RepID=A0A562UHJ6_9SPHI|nr:peroxiredoxin [Mucilaginibacter frigoritolerans]